MIFQGVYYLFIHLVSHHRNEVPFLGFTFCTKNIHAALPTETTFAKSHQIPV